MLAYAVYIEGYDGDSRQDYSDFVQGFLREESALAHARDLTYNRKLSKFRQKNFSDFVLKYRIDNPSPSETKYKIFESKPKYDHSHRNDEEYDREHEKKVHEWSSSVLPEFNEMQKEWEEKYKKEQIEWNSINDNAIPNEVDLDNIELEQQYVVKQIEIFE